MRRSWQLGPVLRGIRGHRAAAVLVVVQFGIGLAITILSVLIADYFTAERHAPPISIERDLTIVELQRSARAPKQASQQIAETLGSLPGVIGATTLADLPLHLLERDVDELDAGGHRARVPSFEAGARIASLASLTLRAGRDFAPGDICRGCTETSAIVSAALAEQLWPGRDPIGLRFVSRAYGTAVVVGVIADTRTYLFGTGPVSVLYAVDRPSSRSVIVIRNAPGRADAVRAALQEALARTTGQHAIITPAIDHLGRKASPVGAVLSILGVIVGTIVVVVLIGSMGLTYFLVATRTREIGLRRAMGATRRDVVRYFLVESILMTIAGTAVGLGIVSLVMPTMLYEQSDLQINWWLIAATLAAVIGLNLLATLIPARKAAAVPPIVASRT